MLTEGQHRKIILTSGSQLNAENWSDSSRNISGTPLFISFDLSIPSQDFPHGSETLDTSFTLAT